MVAKRVVLWAAVVLSAGACRAATFESNWQHLPDRVWIGRDFWANRWQDWRIRSGALEHDGLGGRGALSLLTAACTDRSEPLEIHLRFGLKAKPKALPTDHAAGVAFAPTGPWKGRAVVGHRDALQTGLDGAGRAFIRDSKSILAIAKAAIRACSQPAAASWAMTSLSSRVKWRPCIARLPVRGCCGQTTTYRTALAMPLLHRRCISELNPQR